MKCTIYFFNSKFDRPIQNVAVSTPVAQTGKELRLVGVMILATWSLKHKDTFKIHDEQLSGINQCVASFNQIQIIFKRFDFYYNKNSNIYFYVVKIFSKFNVKIPFRDFRWAAVVYYLKALQWREVCVEKKYIRSCTKK